MIVRVDVYYAKIYAGASAALKTTTHFMEEPGESPTAG